MLTAKKIATDRRNAFMIGARHFIREKLAQEDRFDAVSIIKEAADAANEVARRLKQGNSREVLQLKIALAQQGISV